MTEHFATPDRPEVPGDDDTFLTRSEEQLRIATYRRPIQRVRLRKRVVTETMTRLVTVRREEVSLEYEPITADDEGAPTPGSEPANGRWMVLYQDEVVITTRRVPRERVRLQTHTITEQHEISEALRHERLALDEASGQQ